MPVYADLGVKRVINAWGPMTIIGSALVRPEVIAAMAEAAESYVDMIELQRAAGKRLAELIGVEACYVAAGSAAGLAIVTAALMTGGDQAREVGHIDHEERPDLVGDFPEPGKIQGPRIGRTAGDNELGLVLPS